MLDQKNKIETKQETESSKTDSKKKISVKQTVSDNTDANEGEKKLKLNKATTKAGLMFNVATFKKWMKEQFAIRDDVLVPKVTSGHIALAACCEELLKYILDASKHNLKKDKVQLYEINADVLIHSVQTNFDLKKTFGKYIEDYDDGANYGTQFPIEKNIVTLFIDKYFGKNINLSNEGYNVLAFLLTKLLQNAMKYSADLIAYAKKKSLCPENIKYTLKLLVSDSIFKILSRKIEEVCPKEVQDAEKDGKNDDNEEKNEEEDEEDEEDEEEEVVEDVEEDIEEDVEESDEEAEEEIIVEEVKSKKSNSKSKDTSSSNKAGKGTSNPNNKKTK